MASLWLRLDSDSCLLVRTRAGCDGIFSLHTPPCSPCCYEFMTVYLSATPRTILSQQGDIDLVKFAYKRSVRRSVGHSRFPEPSVKVNGCVLVQSGSIGLTTFPPASGPFFRASHGEHYRSRVVQASLLDMIHPLSAQGERALKDSNIHRSS